MATYYNKRKFIIPVDSVSNEEAKKAIAELICDYKEDIWFPERVPDLLSNELNVDNELLQDLIDEWKKHFINDSTGTINEYISQEIKRFRNKNVGVSGSVGMNGNIGVSGSVGMNGTIFGI
jgi:hypothetical protein